MEKLIIKDTDIKKSAEKYLGMMRYDKSEIKTYMEIDIENRSEAIQHLNHLLDAIIVLSSCNIAQQAPDYVIGITEDLARLCIKMLPMGEMRFIDSIIDFEK